LKKYKFTYFQDFLCFDRVKSSLLKLKFHCPHSPKVQPMWWIQGTAKNWCF